LPSYTPEHFLHCFRAFRAYRQRRPDNCARRDQLVDRLCDKPDSRRANRAPSGVHNGADAAEWGKRWKRPLSLSDLAREGEWGLGQTAGARRSRLDLPSQRARFRSSRAPSLRAICPVPRHLISVPGRRSVSEPTRRRRSSAPSIEQYPTLMSLGPLVQAPAPSSRFRPGLAVVLDGIQAAVAASRGGRKTAGPDSKSARPG